LCFEKIHKINKLLERLREKKEDSNKYERGDTKKNSTKIQRIIID
jgi:hypothetical protein